MITEFFWNTVLDLTEPLWYGGRPTRHTPYCGPRISREEIAEQDKKIAVIMAAQEERKRKKAVLARQKAKLTAMESIRSQPYFGDKK